MRMRMEECGSIPYLGIIRCEVMWANRIPGTCTCLVVVVGSVSADSAGGVKPPSMQSGLALVVPVPVVSTCICIVTGSSTVLYHSSSRLDIIPYLRYDTLPTDDT